jgi:serine/threonine-protein kinase
MADLTNEPEPVRVFISYAHEDEKFRTRLEKHLSILRRNGVISAWHDRNIQAGKEWGKEIDENIESSKMILLLVSADFLASDYCYDIEMRRAMEKHEAGESRVIPIILKPTDWSGAPFSKLQALPNNAKPVTTWKKSDDAWDEIARGIRQVCEEMRSLSTQPHGQAKDLEPDTLTLPSSSQDAEIRTRLPQNPPSIAVLPFADMSADEDNEYFCDGLAEELLNALAKIEGLKVAARTSAFSFKGKNVPVSEIGAALRVQVVLEGSVREAGNKLRITVQLVSVADGYYLWSERYDREMKDIFDVQDEITLAVVEALKVKLLGEKKSAVLKHHTADPETYELYLKGRYYYNKYTPEAWAKALEFFDRAIEKEPEYAPAYAAKALCLGISNYYGALPAEAIPEWRAMTNRALELDSDSADAHLSKAVVHSIYEWDWAAAEREYQLTVELNPNNPDARQFYGVFLASRGRFEQAVGEGRRALESDPLSLSAHFNMAWIYWFADRQDDTLEQVRRMLELEPNYFGAYWLRGSAYAALERYEESIEAIQKSLILGWNQMALGNLGTAYGILGKRDEAERVLEQLLELRKRQNIYALNIARVYSGLGENDKTLEWLERAVAERNMELVFFEVGTKVGAKNTWGKSMTDPRIIELLRRAGLIS